MKKFKATKAFFLLWTMRDFKINEIWHWKKKDLNKFDWNIRLANMIYIFSNKNMNSILFWI